MKRLTAIFAFLTIMSTTFSQTFVFTKSEMPTLSSSYVQAQALNMEDVITQIDQTFSNMEDRIGRKVNLKVLVNREGRDIRHRYSTLYPRNFVHSVEAYIGKLSFQPAMENGNPVASWVGVFINFSLE